LEPHLPFLDDVKNFDRVKREKWFEILKSTNIPKLLLKSTKEIFLETK